MEGEEKDLSDLMVDPVGKGEEVLRVVEDGDKGTNGEGEAVGEDNMLEEYLGSKKEDVGCSNLDTLFVTNKDAIEDVSDGKEEAEDGDDKDVGGEDGIAEAKDRGVRDGRGGGWGEGGKEEEVDKGEEDEAKSMVATMPVAQKTMITTRVLNYRKEKWLGRSKGCDGEVNPNPKLKNGQIRHERLREGT